jgi:phosphate/sulfate permease
MKAHDRLAKTLALGKKRYVIFHGVLGWGLLTAVLINAFTLMRQKEWNVFEIAANFVVFPLMGIFWGLAMWAYIKWKAAKTN